MLNKKLQSLKRFPKQLVLNEIFRINDGSINKVDLLVLDSMLSSKTKESIKKVILLTDESYNKSESNIESFLDRVKIKHDLFQNKTTVTNLLTLKPTKY